MNKRTDWVMLGRLIGTATGWDQGDTFALSLYDFEPAEGVCLPKGDPYINFESGVIEYWSDDGQVVVYRFDLIDVLQNAEKRSL